MKFPKHITLSIEHNPHATNYETVLSHLEWIISHGGSDYVWKCEQDREEAVKTNDFWTIQWYPDTPVGFCHMAAPTIEKLLQYAAEEE